MEDDTLLQQEQQLGLGKVFGMWQVTMWIYGLSTVDGGCSQELCITTKFVWK